MRNVRSEEKTARRIIQAGLLVFQVLCVMLLMRQAGFLAAAAGVVGIGYTIADVRRMGWPTFGATDAAFIFFYATVAVLDLL